MPMIIKGTPGLAAFVTLGVAASALTSCAGARDASTTSAADGSVATASEHADPGNARCGDPVQGLADVTASIVFAGEIHGTNEFPDTFSRMVCQIQTAEPGRTILVVLEFPVSMQPAVESFMAGDGDAASAALTQQPFWRREYQDGRSSKAMVRLLESLRGLQRTGASLIVRGMDVDHATSNDERDAGMAKNLAEAIEQVRPARTLVYSGDIHARTVPGYPWAPADPFRSVASRVGESLGGVAAIGLKTNGGTAWTCTTAVASECGAKSLPERRTPQGQVGRLEPVPPENTSSGFQWTLNVGQVSASAPAAAGAKLPAAPSPPPGS